MRGRSSAKNPGVFLSADTKKSIKWALSIAPGSWESKTLVELLDDLGDRWDSQDVQISAAQRTYLKRIILPTVSQQNPERLTQDQLRYFDEFRFFCSDKL